MDGIRKLFLHNKEGMMTIEQKKETEKEFERVKSILDGMGIAYEVHRPYISFMDDDGNECMVFPSQTYDDKLVVSFRRKERFSNAEDALRACGVIDESVYKFVTA